MTIIEVADHTRITPRGLFKRIAAGDGPTVTKIGRRTLIREDHFRAWLQSKARLPARNA